MIRLGEWVDIISLSKQGLSIKAIARRTGVSRNTVRAALRRDGPGVTVAAPFRAGSLDACHRDKLLCTWIENYPFG